MCICVWVLFVEDVSCWFILPFLLFKRLNLVIWIIYFPHLLLLIFFVIHIVVFWSVVIIFFVICSIFQIRLTSSIFSSLLFFHHISVLSSSIYLFYWFCIIFIPFCKLLFYWLNSLVIKTSLTYWSVSNTFHFNFVLKVFRLNNTIFIIFLRDLWIIFKLTWLIFSSSCLLFKILIWCVINVF